MVCIQLSTCQTQDALESKNRRIVERKNYGMTRRRLQNVVGNEHLQTILLVKVP